MKIIVASSGLGHVSRGIEAWADDLGAALHDRGENVLLCKGAGTATRPFERVVSCWQRASEKTLRLRRWMPRFVWRLGLGSGYDVEQTTFAWNLVKLLRREDADIVHVQDPRLALLIQRARCLGLVRARTILAHGTEEPATFLKRIAHLQHLAPWHLKEMQKVGAWRPGWTAIPNFIDTARFAPGESDELRAELGIPADGIVVLTAAAIKRNHKRIDYLISEFAKLRSMRPELPVWLVVAGGWDSGTDELVAEGQRLLGDRVRFLVRFPRARMADLYRCGDVFVLCSLFEMMPIALLEATASGLPCLVSQHPVVSWMIGPGGKAIDMALEGELANQVAALAADTAERGKLAQAARAHCMANFSTEPVVDRILDYYRFVVADDGQGIYAECSTA